MDNHIRRMKLNHYMKISSKRIRHINRRPKPLKLVEDIRVKLQETVFGNHFFDMTGKVYMDT